jgi:hypothetical protein
MELNKIKSLLDFHFTYPESERGTRVYLLSPSFASCLISLVGYICLKKFIYRVIDPLTFRVPDGIVISTNRHPVRQVSSKSIYRVSHSDLATRFLTDIGEKSMS